MTPDDLQRLRDGIAQGWNMRHCHGIDFEAAVIELLDDALEQCDGDKLAELIEQEFPADDCLAEVIGDLNDEIESAVDNEGEVDLDILRTVVIKLEKIQADIAKSWDLMQSAINEAHHARHA